MKTRFLTWLSLCLSLGSILYDQTVAAQTNVSQVGTVTNQVVQVQPSHPQGRVHQRDLGKDTARIEQKTNACDPDPSWHASAD